jgi:CheY-like chemotaxis protein
VDTASGEEQREAADMTAPGGSETILVAEDDAVLRELTATILQSRGYSVITAVDGNDAVEKFQENKDRVRLVILDGIMPKKNGRQASDEILSMQPSVKALFLSGYAADVVSKEGLLEKGVNFVSKPVAPAELLRTVRKLLDA